MVLEINDLSDFWPHTSAILIEDGDNVQTRNNALHSKNLDNNQALEDAWNHVPCMKLQNDEKMIWTPGDNRGDIISTENHHGIPNVLEWVHLELFEEIYMPHFARFCKLWVLFGGNVLVVPADVN